MRILSRPTIRERTATRATASQYLLSGFLRCGVCGGNLIVTARSGRGGVKRYWICTVAHHRGKDICSNSQGIPYEALHTAVVDCFKESFCNPLLLASLVRSQLQELAAAPDEAKEEMQALRRDLSKLEGETNRLVEGLATGTGDVAPVMAAIQTRERQKADLQARLEHLDGVQQASQDFDVAGWMIEMGQVLADVRKFFDPDAAVARGVDDPASARQLFRMCLPKPLVVSPDGQGGWTFEGEGVFVEGDIRKQREISLQSRGVQGHVQSASNPVPLRVVPPG